MQNIDLMQKEKGERDARLHKNNDGIFGMLLRYDFDVVELLNGLTFIGLGVLMLFSPEDQVAIAPALRDIPFIFTLPVLGTINILLGIWKIGALRFGSTNHRRWLTFAMVFAWAFYTILFSDGTYRNFVIFFTGELSLFSVWAFIRLTLKHRGERLIDPRNQYHGS